MNSSGLRSRRVHLAVLLGVLVLLASAERRLAYLDFDSVTGVRYENNEKPDGNEIINRLVFVDDATEPVVPTTGDTWYDAFLSADSNIRALFVVRLSESRAPPFAVSPLV